jgi:hypothetical protein
VVTWAIIGGADQSKFQLVGSILRWVGDGVKDYEAPDDVGLDNTYTVQVSATDLSLQVTTQTITVNVLDVADTPPAAPELLITSDNLDLTPDFTTTGDFLLDDVIRFQYSTSPTFSGASEMTTVIDAAADAANAISFETGELAETTWYFRVRIERPSLAVSGWSNTETITLGSPVSYVGPGDIVGGALGWWGGRAYSAASIGMNAIRIARSSDSAEQDFVTLASGALDTASIATFIGAGSGRVTKLYDQTGNGRHLAESEIDGPLYIASGDWGKPQFNFVGSVPNTLWYTTTITLSQPFTGVVFARHTTSGGQQSLLMAGSTVQIGYTLSLANQVFAYASDIGSATASDNAFHAIQVVFNDDSSVIQVDTTSTNVDAGPSGMFSGGFYIGRTNSGAQGFDGSMSEAGMWNIAFDSTQRTNMQANIAGFYGL